MPGNTITSAIILTAIILALWFGIIFAIATIGGWRRLAARYPGLTPSHIRRGTSWWQPRARWRLTSIAVRYLLAYNFCVLWRADDDHLHLRIAPPVNIFHPPISIPWSEIEVVRIGRLIAHLRIAGIPLRISRRLVANSPAAVGVSTRSALGS